MSSRVDEERDAARAAQRLAEAKRTEQTKKTERTTADVGFSKLVGKQQAHQAARASGESTTRESTAKSAIAHLLHEAEAAATEHVDTQHSTEAHHEQASTQSLKQNAQTKQASLGAHTRADGHQTEQARAGSAEAQATSTKGRAVDLGAGGVAVDGRKSDAKMQREILAERGASSDAKQDSSEGSAVGARGEKGELKADADKGGGGHQGGGKEGKDGAPAMMRFNPALMAPVGIAKPKEATGSDRLRKVANELAQKIVERVRVGTNSAGKVEFQIDLRSDVLSGLQVKVSSHNGKINATFSGSNKDVLKLVEEQGDALKAALAARGLTLEDFKVERRP